MMNRGLATLFALSTMWGGPTIPTIKQKEIKKCLLPGCENVTSHNGGYCCAEHCRKHKEALRQ